MKLFMRGVLAFGVSALIAAAASADTPPPPVANAKIGTATAGAAPAPAPAINGNCGCVEDAGIDGGRRRLGGRLGGRSARTGGGRVDGIVERYEGGRAGFSAFLQRLAGPPVEGSAAPAGGVGKKGGPHTQPGTVVFPQHPFVRSPRDFFMMGE